MIICYTFSIKLSTFCHIKEREIFEWIGECEKLLQNYKPSLGPRYRLSYKSEHPYSYTYQVINNVVSFMLVQKLDCHERLIYFVRSLKGRSWDIKKYKCLTFAMVISARNLRSYCQVHKFLVKINHPDHKFIKKIVLRE